MDAYASTCTDHCNALAWHNVCSFTRNVIGGGHRVSDHACLAQDDALGNAHQIPGRDDDIFGKGPVDLCPNMAFMVDAQRFSPGSAHDAIATEEIERAGYRIALTPFLYPSTRDRDGSGILVAH